MKKRYQFETLESRHLLAADVVINEILASNQTVLFDADGDSSDWLELLNTSNEAVSLAGYSLTDDAANLTKWTLPEVTLGAGEFLIVFASDKDRADANSELHTNFKLSANGEFLALVAPDGVTIVSGYSPEFPAQTGDVSYGLAPDGTSSQFFVQPTPGAANDSAPTNNGRGDVVISEIMYHPQSDLTDDEYLELYNRGSESVLLGGWQLTDGVTFTFPNYTLPAKGTVIVAANVDQFLATYGSKQNLVGGWSGKLSDSSERIELQDASGTVVNSLTYADEGDWAQRTRGELDRNH